MYPGRAPRGGPQPFALPGLALHQRDPRFADQSAFLIDNDDQPPPFEETWSHTSLSDTTSRILVPDDLDGPHVPSLPRRGRSVSFSDVAEGQDRLPHFGTANDPEAAELTLTARSLDSNGNPRSPHLSPSGSQYGSENTASGSTISGSTPTSGTGSGSTVTSSDDSEEEDETPFVELLDEDLYESLRDGEDFDYIGLMAHPTTGLDEDKLKENLESVKEIVNKIKDQPWHMRRKMKLYRISQIYIGRYEGRLNRGRANAANLAKFFKQIRRNLENLIAVLQPWEERIKSIENRFGSAAASYFILLRWVIWINLIQTFFILGLVMVPELIWGEKNGETWRTTMTKEEISTALTWSTIYHYGGYIKYTPVYYGYYSDNPSFSFGYRLPLAYLATTLAILLHSFWAVLAK